MQRVFRFRVWFFVLAFLIIFDIIARIGLEIYFEKNDWQKLPFASSTFYEETCKKVKKFDGFKIVVLGDSTLWGTNLGEEKIVSFYLQKLIDQELPDKNIKVFNLALRGGTPKNTYLSLNKVLQTKPDLVIINLNYSIYFQKASLKYPWLAEEKRQINFWKIYQEKDTISFILFGDSPSQAFFKLIVDWEQIIQGRKTPKQIALSSWREKDFNPEEAKRFYPDKLFNPNNSNIFYTQHAIDLLEEEKIPAIFFLTPINQVLAGCIVDTDNFASNQKAIKNWFQNKKSIVYFNWQDKISEQYFTDYNHYTPEGHQVLAELIFNEVYPILIRQFEVD